MAHASKSNLRLTALALALASMGAQADTYTWATDSSGLWTLSTNWAPLGPPMQGSDVVITVTGMKTITHSQSNDSISTLKFEASAVDPNAVLVVNSGSLLAITAGGTNGGVIRADNGTVNFTGGTLVNNGTLDAINNGTIAFSNATLQGGKVTSAGGGGITLANYSVLDGTYRNDGYALINNGTITALGGNTSYLTGTLVNNGNFVIGANAALRVPGSGGTAVLSGSGTTTLTDANSTIFGDSGANSLAIGPGQTVQGIGNIGSNQLLVTNSGVVTANQNNGTLTLDPTDGVGGFVNQGTLRAENGGTLQITNGTYTNANPNNGNVGQINALTGSAVIISNATILGGTISTVGTGVVTVTNGSVLDGSTAGNLTLAGNISTAGGNTVYALGTFNDNNLTIGANSSLRIQGTNNLTLANGGILTLTDQNSQVFGDNGNDRLTNTTGNTIQGVGAIGSNQAFITNAGLITANVLNQTLTIDPTDGIASAAGVINSGTLRAENGGTLQLQPGFFNNNGGTITALNTSAVNVNNSTIQGGTLSTTGSGVITLSNGAVLDGSTYGTTTLTGNINTAGGNTVYALGTLNDNNLTVGANSTLRIQGSNNLTLANNGTVTLTDVNSQIFGDNGNDRLTNTLGNTIQGPGNIGSNQALITNAGLITANKSGQTLTIDPTDGSALAAGIINTGTLRAEGGGTLLLQPGYFNNAGGTITALNTSAVNVNNSNIQGGTLSTAGSGVITISNSAVLDGLTNGAMNLTGTVNIAGGNTAYAFGTLNDNTLTVGGNSSLRILGTNNLTLANSGTLTLTDVNSQVFGDNGNDRLTNTLGNTIQGTGNIAGNQMLLTNAGLITANVSGQTLTIDPTDGDSINAGVINTGTLQAQGGGTLQLSPGHFNNQGGTIAALVGSTVVLAGGAVIEGGTLSTTSTGTIAMQNGVILDGTAHGALTNGGTIVGAGGITDYVTGSIINNGAITIGGNAALRVLGATNATLSGTGTVTLTDVNTQVFGDNGNDLLTIGAGQTIRGVGNLGAAQLALTNAGTISANVNGATLNVQPSSTLMNLSTGTLLATNGGTLNVISAVAGTGTIQSDSGSNVVLNQATATGKLVNNGNLNLNGQVVTVSSDYNNANFGVGNAFNRNANVTGGGAIVASGDVGVGVSGANVTAIPNSTASALTIGNVRVGANTFNYQVTNTGTDGPAIRGAIQTQFSTGSSITDSRLSGTGVIAGNYGPVAAGSSSGNFGVTFTTATAGQLAPLANSPGYGTGQAVFIADNFANVSGRVLQINLASGAAAYNVAQPNVPTTVNLGNVHVGGSLSQAVTIGNTNIGPSGYQEGLDVATGVRTNGATASGSITNLAAGSTSNAINLGLANVAAGNQSGTVALALASNGSTTSGLATMALAPASVTVNATGYNLAQSSTIGAINFGLHHVGDGPVTQNVSVMNTAAAGNYSEGLDTSFGAVTGTGSGKITTSGVVTNLAAGSTNSNTLQVTLNTSQVGTVNGNIRVIQASNGTISGLGNTALADQNPAVTADVEAMGTTVRYAVGQINNAPVSFGNVRINTAQSQALSITNAVPNDGFSESLVASVAGSSGKATGAGGFGPPSSVPSLAPSTTDSTHVIVGLDTSASGHQTGTVGVDFKSDGTAFAGGTVTDLGVTTVGVSGDVYRTAAPLVNTQSVTVAGRVGVTGPTTGISISNSSADMYQEGLSVSRGATSAGFTSTGSLTNLTAGGTSSAIGVTLNTTTAGTFTGTQALAFTSTGAGTTNAADLSVGSGTVNLNGKVYTTAAATSASSVDFGIVHVGDTVAARGVSVTNSATMSALNDTLVAQAAGATGPFNNSGSLGSAGLAAQQTSMNALQVGLSTANAGTYSGVATFSAASHDPDLSDAALASLAVSLTGQVNNYATDAFKFGNGAGTLSRNGSTFVLDYGTVMQGSGTEATTLYATNDAVGPADLLDGTFEGVDTNDFGDTFANFMGLVAGANSGPLTFSFDTSTIGQFMDTIVLHGVGYNASDYSAAIGDIQLIIRGTVNERATGGGSAVPEPDSLLLLGLGIPLLFIRRRKASPKAN